MTDASIPTDTVADEEAFASYINELREILALSIVQPINIRHVQMLRSHTDALLTQLRQHRQKRALPLYNVKKTDSPFTDKECNELQPYSPVAGSLNPIAPPLVFRIDRAIENSEGVRVHGEVTLGPIYEGPPGCVHGAVLSAIYDQLLATANVVAGTAGPTAWLKVNFTKPTPLNVPLKFVAWKAEQDGRKILMRGQCFAGDDLVTDCEALFIQFIPKGVADAVKR